MITWIKKYKKSVIAFLATIVAVCTFLITNINKFVPDPDVTTTIVSKDATSK